MSQNQSRIEIVGVDNTRSAFASIVKNVDEVNKKVGGLQSSFSSLGSIITGLGGAAALTGLVASFGSVVKSAIDLGDEFDNLKARTGIAVESLGGLKFLAEQTDLSLETLAKGIRKVGQLTLDAKRGNEEAADSFRKLGLDVERLSKLTPEQQFREYFKALRNINEEQRALAINDTLGPKFVELATLAAVTTEEYDSLIGKGKELYNITSEQAKASADFNDQLDILKSSVSSLGISIAGPLVESLNLSIARMKEATSVGKTWLQVLGAGISGAFETPIQTGPELSKKESAALKEKIKVLNDLMDEEKASIGLSKDSDRAIENRINKYNDEKKTLLANLQVHERYLQELKKEETKEPLKSYGGGSDGKGGKPPKSGGKGKSDAVREFERQQAEARKSLEATFDPLEKFNDELSKQFELYSKGFHTTDEYAKIVGHLSTKYYETSDSAKQFKKDQEDANKELVDAFTPAEKFQSELTRLNQLYESGHFSLDEYRKVVANLSTDFMGAAKDAKPAFDRMEEYARQSARSVQSAFSDSIFNILSGNGNPFDNLKNTFLRVASEGMTMQLFEGFEKAFTSPKVGENVGQQAATAFTTGVGRSGFFDAFANIFGSFTGQSGSGSNIWGSLISGVGSLFGSYMGTGSINNLSSVNSYRALPNNSGGFSTNFTALNDLNKSVRGGVSDGFKELAKNNQYGATYGAAPRQGNATAAAIGNIAGMVPVYGTAVAAAFTVFNALDKKYGDYKLNGAAKFGADGLDLALGGPILDAIGLASPVDLVAKFLFGRGPYKLRQQSFQGVLDEQGVTGDINTVYKSKGGLFLKNKYKEIRGDVPYEIENFIDSTVKQAFRDMRFTARSLGINADQLNGFNQVFQVKSDKKTALTDEQIKSVIDNFDDDLAKTLLPNVERFAQAGESASDTFKRIGQEFITLANVGALFGHSLAATRQVLHSASIQERTNLVELMGSMEEFSNKASFFAENFLTDAERLAPMQERLSEEFKRLGLSTKTTKEQFRDLVQSFGSVNGISGDMLVELLTLAPLFIEVNDGVSALNDTLENTVKTLDQLKSDVQAAYDRRSSELNGIKDQFKGILDNLKSFRQSLAQGDLSPLTPAQKLDEARTTYNRTLLAARALDAKALEDFPKVAEEFLQASKVYNASSAAYQSDFMLVQKANDELAQLSKNQVDNADSQLRKLEESVSQLIDLNKNVQSVEDAIIALRDAIATGKGNASITDDQIRSVINNPNISTAEKVRLANINGVSDSQILKAVPGLTQKEITAARNQFSGNAITDMQIRNFVNANQHDLMAVYNAAVANGVSRFRLAEVMGWEVSDIEDWVRKNGVAMFEKGSDFIPRTGMALLHKGESVIPSGAISIMTKVLKAIESLTSEQRQQTGELINSSFESNIKNAEAIATSITRSVRDQAYYNKSYKIAGMR